MTTEPRYFETREEWRHWLAENFETATKVWFVFPDKSWGKLACANRRQPTNK